MSLGKVARKLKRVGKTAYQFRFTSTFEYIELGCNGTWRPEKLRVIWLRNHRRVQSIDVKWEPSEDRGPNGALGKGTFDPSFSVALLVTIYGAATGSTEEFEDKEYKYYIESDGASGKKIVASFNIDISEYASTKDSTHTLNMSFKPVSKKINKAVLGITLQSQFIKQGNAIDDDMQSTFSAVSAGQDSLQFEDLEEEGVVTSDSAPEKGLPQATGDKELVTLGTGERLKRTTLPHEAPKKPERRGTPGQSPFHTPVLDRKSSEPEETENNKIEAIIGTETQVEEVKEAEEGSMYMNLNAEGEIGSAEGELDELPWDGGEEREGETRGEPREVARDRRTTRQAKRQREKEEKEREKQKERERKQKEKKEEKERKIKEKSKSPPPAGTPDSPSILPREKTDTLTNGDYRHDDDNDKDKEGDDSALRAREVVVTKQPNQITSCGQTINVSFDTSNAGDGNLSAVCKGTKNTVVDTTISKDEKTGHFSVAFTPNHADMFVLSVKWCGHDVQGSPFLINLNLLPSAELQTQSEEDKKKRSEESQTNAKLKENGVQVKMDGIAEGVKEETRPNEMQEMRGKSPVILVNDEDPFNMAHEASRMLEEQRAARQNKSPEVSPSTQGRKMVASKETWTRPVNHLYEDMPGTEEDIGPTVSPLDAWLGDGQFSDCFAETVSREKLENAEIIGLYFSANWCPPCRKFLPKLVKFYHHLKQNQKSFELLYISSDYSKQEMIKYMQEQQMPWLSLAFESTIADKLRVDYNVAAIPILTIVSKEGVKLEERARKAVEQSTSSSAVLKLYNKWVEKSQQLQLEEGGEAGGGGGEGSGGEGTVEKKGLFKTLKSAIHKKDSSSDQPGSTGTLESQKSAGEASDTEGGGRITVEQRSRARTKQKLKESASLGPTQEEMEEKLRHLGEVNMSLKQTNDDLNEEVAELKRQIGEFQTKLTHLEQSSKQLEDEKRDLMANLNIRGWLLKKGIKGPTANVWRRRYFRCDQGSKIYYYKASDEGTPQGFIDLDMVVSVQEISPAQQDKNHATFLVQCEGRTYQLQAHDETTMRKWMSAIEYLKNWRQRNVSSESDH